MPHLRQGVQWEPNERAHSGGEHYGHPRVLDLCTRGPRPRFTAGGLAHLWLCRDPA